MSRPPRDRQSGFALLFVFVLILVVVVSGFLIAGTTRVDTQVVNTIRNERIAFYAAEAGIAEAFQRLGLASGTTATVSGVGTFDPTFKGAFAPDSSNPEWEAQIVFTSAGTYPSAYDADTIVTPSIQPATSRLDYSTSTVPSTENLRLRWSVCATVDVSRGCDAPDTIRTIKGKRVLQIVSTGRAGSARRELIMDLHIGDATSAVVLHTDVCPGVKSQGNGELEFPGGVVVNSDCDTAIAAIGNASISAAGPIQVVGEGWAGGDKISPPPTTGAEPAEDPLAGRAVPQLGDFQQRWPQPPAVPPALPALQTRVVKNETVTLSPGIYYGGISVQSNGYLTLAPGVYIMAGGGLSLASNGTLTGNGVMIYNTCAPDGAGGCRTGLGAFGAISIDGGPVDLSAPTSAPAAVANADDWIGIVLFQDRLNPQTVSFTSNAEGTIDGLIYAKDAQLYLRADADLLHSQVVVGSMDLIGGPDILEPTNWLDLGLTAGAPTAVAWSDR